MARSRTSTIPLLILDKASSRGNKGRVMEISGQNINIRTSDDIFGDTLLHFAVHSNISSPDEIIEILDFFINQLGADPNIDKNDKQEPVLQLTIAKRHRDIIDYLVQHGAKADVTDCQGNSLLQFFIQNVADEYETQSQYSAVMREHTKFVELLLEKGFDCDRKNEKGQSALHLAMKNNLQHILPALLKHTRDINFVSDDTQQTLLQLYLNAQLTWVRKNEESFDSTKRKFSIADFSRPYDAEIVGILLERGVSVDHVDRFGQTAVHLAVDAVRIRADLDVVEMLFDRFTNVQSQCGYSLLSTLIEKRFFQKIHSQCYTKMLSTLIRNGVHLLTSENKWRSIYKAVFHKNFYAIELMNEIGTDFSVISENGNNLLHALADSRVILKAANVHCQEKLIDFLVSQGCDVNKRNLEGRTPLHLALRNDSNISVIRKLISHGADVNCRDKLNEATPLHLAVDYGFEDAVKLLLDNGANLNSQSQSGRPIHLATDMSMLKLLLRRKAEVNARDSDGNSALARAIMANWTDHVKELLLCGADVNDVCVVQAVQRYRNEAQISVLHHCFKHRAAKLPYHKEYDSFVTFDSYAKIYERCGKEFDQLKSISIDSYTSLYRWLHMDPNRRYLHYHNEKLRAIVASPTLLEQFPQYSTVILSHYWETETRRQLFETAKKAWFKLTEIHLPDVCLEHVFTHLNTGYLLEIVELTEENNE